MSAPPRPARSSPAPVPDDAPLSREELQRYHRHFVLPHVGREGQERLKASRVAIVGAGGLGAPSAMYLAAAGVGRIGLIDSDAVELSNLQRQIIHGTEFVGRSKLESARARLSSINPHVEVVAHDLRLSAGNALEVLAGYDVTIDGSDNFPTRYLVNDACVLLRRPYVYGAVIRFDGQTSVFGAPGGPCYRCLFREPPPPDMVPSCADGGVLGVLPGIVGTMQAAEAIKLLLGIGEPLIGRLLLVDGLRMRFHEVRVAPDPACPACGTREMRQLIDYERFCAGAAEPAVAAAPAPAELPLEISAEELAPRLAAAAAPLLVDVREPWEHSISALPGARLIPMAQIEAEAASLDPAQEIVLYCHHGIRSRSAAAMLREKGIAGARSLSGGIDRWSRVIDPALPRY